MKLHAPIQKDSAGFTLTIAVPLPEASADKEAARALLSEDVPDEVVEQAEAGALAGRTDARELAALGSSTTGDETTIDLDQDAAVVTLKWPPAPEGTSQKDYVAMCRREARLLLEDALDRAAPEKGTSIDSAGSDL